jgi:hypothetical protein
LYNNTIDAVNSKAQCIAGAPQVIDRSFPIGSKAEIVPNNQLANVHGMNQHATNERAGIDAAHVRAESRTEENIYPGITQRIEFLAKPHQPGRWCLGGKVLSRHGLEAHDNFRQSGCDGSIL